MPEASESQRRSKLAQFGLGYDKAETTVANLSGGERARLLLNLVAMDAPHLLILDEPTNHLDIDSRRALLDALNDYEGAVILITHDRSLMELVADRLWLAADGAVKPFDGDMDDYAKFVLDRARVAARAPSQAAAAAPPAPRPSRRPHARRRAIRRPGRPAEAQAGGGRGGAGAGDPSGGRTRPGPGRPPALRPRSGQGGRTRPAPARRTQAALDAAEREWLAAAEATRPAKSQTLRRDGLAAGHRRDQAGVGVEQDVGAVGLVVLAHRTGGAGHAPMGRVDRNGNLGTSAGRPDRPGAAASQRGDVGPAGGRLGRRRRLALLPADFAAASGPRRARAQGQRHGQAPKRPTASCLLLPSAFRSLPPIGHRKARVP